MKSTRWLFRAVCGTASLILVGCWTPTPYGYSTYPGYYAPPNQGFVAPSGPTMSPGMTYPPPQLGAPAIPGIGGTWTPAPGPGPTPAIGPTPSPMSPGPMTPLPGAPPQSFNGGSPPYSDPRIGSSRQPDVRVPDPIEPGPRVSPGPPAAAPTDQNTSPFGSDGKESFDKGAGMQVPKGGDVGPQPVAAAGPESFENPLEPAGKLDSGVVAVAAKTVDAKTRADSPNRYDYDRGSYSYLRGVVDFDPGDKSWHIIYNPKPDSKDKYGGAFQLIDNPKLNTLHDGDVVFIQGRVNLHQVDSHGKPKYEVGDELARITFRGTQSVGN